MFKSSTNGVFSTCCRCRLLHQRYAVPLQRNFRSLPPCQNASHIQPSTSAADRAVSGDASTPRLAGMNIRRNYSKRDSSSAKKKFQLNESRRLAREKHDLAMEGLPEGEANSASSKAIRSPLRNRATSSKIARQEREEKERAVEDKMQAAQQMMKAAEEKMKAAEETLKASSSKSKTAEEKLDPMPNEDTSDFEPVKASDLKLQPIDHDMPPVPRLAHGLDRVLFNPGPMQLRDIHSRVYNFDQYLETITPANQINFETLKGFVPPSGDSKLAKVCIENNKRYTGSTSSLSGVLSAFHFLLSEFRPLTIDHLSSKTIGSMNPQITEINRLPSSVFLRWNKQGYYSIDSDNHDNFASVLSLMGRYLERFLTVNESEFELHKKGAPATSTSNESLETESHHYTSIGDLVIRSQLDAYDPRLPGTGVFDLKTRAVLPIRVDPYNFQHAVGYELRQMQGYYSSFERETADIFRSALLKYSLQARMGRMDGIFVTFHNIVRLFGFQYFSLDEMDRVLHGQPNRDLGDQEFLYSVHLLNKVFNLATQKYPEQTLRITLETRGTSAKRPQMDAFAEPIAEDAVEEIKQSRLQEVERWEQEFLATGKTTHIFDPSISEPQAHALRFCDNDPDGPVLHISLQTRSDVDGIKVRRPVDLQPWQSWNIKYKLESNENREEVLPLYRNTKRRIRELVDDRSQTRRKNWMRELIQYVQEGKTWRRDLNRNDARIESEQGGVKMWNSDDPIKRRASSL